MIFFLIIQYDQVRVTYDYQYFLWFLFHWITNYELSEPFASNSVRVIELVDLQEEP